MRARVAGIVTRRLYEEGQDVRAGTVLFQIDPAPLKAALDISRGALALSLIHILTQVPPR